MNSHDDAVPDVLIQHPAKKVNYLVPGERLVEFTVGPDTWSQFGTEAVTFVLATEEDLLGEIPPVNREPDANPAIHIQHPEREAAYYISAEQLEEFAVEEVGEYGISFVVPMGHELIEEMPALMRGLLQTQESPRLVLKSRSSSRAQPA
jgi:hypothetical protein